MTATTAPTAAPTADTVRPGVAPHGPTGYRHPAPLPTGAVLPLVPLVRFVPVPLDDVRPGDVIRRADRYRRSGDRIDARDYVVLSIDTEPTTADGFALDASLVRLHVLALSPSWSPDSDEPGDSTTGHDCTRVDYVTTHIVDDADPLTRADRRQARAYVRAIHEAAR